jgi:hypothetical protein
MNSGVDCQAIVTRGAGTAGRGGWLAPMLAETEPVSGWISTATYIVGLGGQPLTIHPPLLAQTWYVPDGGLTAAAVECTLCGLFNPG